MGAGTWAESQEPVPMTIVQKRKMKRKEYQKPTTKVVQLKHRHQLLTVSNSVEAQRNSYGTAIESTWSEE